MRTITLFTALTGLALASTVALAGCTGSPTDSDQPDTTAPGSDPAAAFLACLTAADVDARINDSGQILVNTGEELASSGSISSDIGGGEFLAMEVDDAGILWIAPVNAGYFVDDPDTQDAYAACEEAHLEFTQPEFDPGDDPAFQEDAQKQEEDALAFAQCARDEGYAQIADPDFSTINGILIPAGFTEQEFRALIEACWDPASNFAFGSTGELDFEPWTIIDELQNAPAS